MIVVNTKFAVRLSGRHGLGDEEIDKINTANLNGALTGVLISNDAIWSSTMPAVHDFSLTHSFFRQRPSSSFIVWMHTRILYISFSTRETCRGDHIIRAIDSLHVLRC